MNQVKLLIDTDPGIDDAMAIFFASLHPSIDVVGMSTVFGNVTVETATRNAIYLSELLRKSIPVAKGAGTPMTQNPKPISDYAHGKEGFGDLPAQEIQGKALEEQGSEFICRMINEYPGEITLCPIGPLTNIAAALKLDPTITTKVKEVIIMGGSLFREGNVSIHAEANIWHDAHAADKVFAADWPVVMVGLDVTHEVMCTNEDFKRLALSSPVLGGFLEKLSAFYINFYKQKVGVDGCYLHDPAAVIAAIHSELFTTEEHPLEVIVSGRQIGRVVKSVQASRRKMKVCTAVQSDAVKELFINTLSTGF